MISPSNYGDAWRSCSQSPVRSHGVLTEAEGFHGSLCRKKGM
jgi:hypothetical protein